jgi:hypothetical protein
MNKLTKEEQSIISQAATIRATRMWAARSKTARKKHAQMMNLASQKAKQAKKDYSKN